MNVDIPLGNLCLRGGQWWRKQALKLVNPIEYIFDQKKFIVVFFSIPIFFFYSFSRDPRK